MNEKAMSEDFTGFENPRVIIDNGKTVTIIGTCPVSKEGWTVEVPRMSYYQFMVDDRNALNLPTDEKELLVSGITRKGWDMLETIGGSGDEDA